MVLTETTNNGKLESDMFCIFISLNSSVCSCCGVWFQFHGMALRSYTHAWCDLFSSNMNKCSTMLSVTWVAKPKAQRKLWQKRVKQFPVSSSPAVCLSLMCNTWMFRFILHWCKLNNMWKLVAVRKVKISVFFYRIYNAERWKEQMIWGREQEESLLSGALCLHFPPFFCLVFCSSH